MNFVGIFTINPHETTLVLLGLPRGLTACCICSMQSCHLRKWCLLGLSFYFTYLPEDVQMLSVGMFDRIYFYIYFRWFYSHIYCVLHWFGFLFNRFDCFIVGNKESMTWKDLEQKVLFWDGNRRKFVVLGYTGCLHCLGRILSSRSPISAILQSTRSSRIFLQFWDGPLGKVQLEEPRNWGANRAANFTLKSYSIMDIYLYIH